MVTTVHESMLHCVLNPEPAKPAEKAPMADTAVPPDLPVALPAELETIASPEAREAAIQRTVGVLGIALAELHDAFDWSAVEEAMAQPRTGSAGNPVDTQPKPTGRSRSVLVPDNLTQDGAEVVAEQLDAYWHSLGYASSKHWTEQAHAGPCVTWVVRSNLRDGLPPPPLPTPPRSRKRKRGSE